MPKLTVGTKYCQCGACKRYFTSPTTFDMHRVGEPGSRYCRHPGHVLDKQRRPRLRLNDKGYWASNRVMAKHW
jgi:hypothetical protein